MASHPPTLKIFRFILLILITIYLAGITLLKYQQAQIAKATLLGDCSQNGVVDVFDLQLLSNSFNRSVGQTGYNANCNFNGDTIVDLFDFQILSNNYGNTGAISSTPTPQPSTTPSLTFQPKPPYYSTFFYPWSENPNTDGHWGYWTDHNNNPPNTWFSHYLPDYDTTKFDPSSELYSSQNDAVVLWQLRKLKEAKIEVAISSWWGQNHKTDIAFKKILTNTMNRTDNPYPNMRWVVYYELEGFGDPAVSQISSDLNYIAANYTNQKGYLKINGKPVIFVYGGTEDTATSGYTTRWANANSQSNTKFYIVLKVFPGYQNVIPQPDSWHQYAPAVRTDNQGRYSFLASPGFWLDDGSPVRLSRDIGAFRNAVQNMVSSNAMWKIVETWNEWGEGSSVEPGDQVRTNSSTGKEELDPNAPAFKNSYIDILNQLLPPLE